MTTLTPGQKLIAAYRAGEIGDFPDLARAIDEAIAGQWQDIETAPKDGTRVLIYRGPEPNEPDVGFWALDRWFSQSNEISLWGAFPPTHWMPLPDRPADAGSMTEDDKAAVDEMLSPRRRGFVEGLIGEDLDHADGASVATVEKVNQIE
jgi:hypothetical protein